MYVCSQSFVSGTHRKVAACRPAEARVLLDAFKAPYHSSMLDSSCHAEPFLHALKGSVCVSEQKEECQFLFQTTMTLSHPGFVISHEILSNAWYAVFEGDVRVIGQEEACELMDPEHDVLQISR